MHVQATMQNCRAFADAEDCDCRIHTFSELAGSCLMARDTNV